MARRCGGPSRRPAGRGAASGPPAAAVRRAGGPDRPAQEDRAGPRRVAFRLARDQHLAVAGDRRLQLAAREQPALLVLAGEEAEPLRLARAAVQPDPVAAALGLR